MPQSPQDQRAIVQRMIDAGESEENIATVIQHFKTTAKTDTAPPSGASGGYGALATVGDAVVGAGKRLLGYATQGQMMGVGLPREVIDVMQLHPSIKPSSTAQSVGSGAVDAGVAMLPGGQITRAGQAVARLAPRGLGIIGRAAVEGVGNAAIAGAQGYDPTIAGAVGGVAGAAAGTLRGVRGAMVNPNAVEREALEYVASKGVPVDAGTMSGNAALKGAKYLADKSVAGSVVATKELQREAQGLATLGEQLAAKTGQSAQTPLSAGESIQSALESRIKNLHAEASQNYDALRQMEAANVQKVITGSGPSRTGVVRAMTQTADIGFPVQLKPVKAVLRPVYERIQRQMPILRQQASEGFKALENIINGPDLAAASQVDADLSAIKAIVRGADAPELRDLSQGLAAKAVSELDAAVNRAVAQGGVKATQALQQGRQATKAKYLTADILNSLRKEPVKAFRQATERGDASLAKLRELHSVVPTEIPKLGRAYLDNALETATAEKGFKGAVSLANNWQALGPETKKLLFPTPGLTNELDKFFLAAKRLAENPNPSGTGGVVSLGTQGTLFLINPALGFGTQIAAAAGSKLLRDPTVVRLLTQGLTAKPNSVTAQALKQALIRALDGKDDQ